MKRRRRVEVRIEHHELSIFAGAPAADAGNPATQEAALALGVLARCPTCGSAQMLPLSIALRSTDAASLKEGLESGRYHLHSSVSGEWWVCGQSSPSANPSG